MRGFLQNFNKDGILLESSDGAIAGGAVEKAIEIAMLGLSEEFNAICRILATHGQLKSSAERLELQAIWKYSGLTPPNLDQSSNVAVSLIQDEELRKQSFAATRRFKKGNAWPDYYDEAGYSRATIESLEQDIEAAMCDAGPLGSNEMKLSADYAALIAIAYDLNVPSVIDKHMPMILRRIHADHQAYYITLVPEVWRDYFLPGRLRAVIDVPENEIKDYAQCFHDTIKKRLDHGLYRPEALYPGYGIAQLLEVIDRNTVSDEWLMDMKDPSIFREGDMNDSVLRKPVTEEQITAAEIRFGRSLPEDFKEFYRYTNGCTLIPAGEKPYVDTLQPLEDITVPPWHYELVLLPELSPYLSGKIDWPQEWDGDVCMFTENGPRSTYVWLVSASDIRVAKQRFEEAYETFSSEDRALVDRSIVYWFGSREAFDACQDHCYYEASMDVGDQGIYPTFKAYLAEVASRSGSSVYLSPVKIPAGLIIP